MMVVIYTIVFIAIVSIKAMGRLASLNIIKLLQLKEF